MEKTGLVQTRHRSLQKWRAGLVETASVEVAHAGVGHLEELQGAAVLQHLLLGEQQAELLLLRGGDAGGVGDASSGRAREAGACGSGRA